MASSASHDPEGPHLAAAGLLGIPHVQGGRDFRPFVGAADCLGVCLEFLRRIGIDAHDPWSPEAWSDTTQASSLLPMGWREVDPSDGLRIGDVGETGEGRHVCVYVGGGFVLHSARGRDSFLFPVQARACEALRVARWWRWSC